MAWPRRGHCRRICWSLILARTCSGAGADAGVGSVVVVADDPAVGCAAWSGDRGNAAVAAVTQDGAGAVDQMPDSRC